MANVSRNPFVICNVTKDFNDILLPVTYGFVLIVGLPLNLICMYAIFFRIKKWSSSTVYMINLTVCDTLYILTLPFLIYYYVYGKYWPFTEVFCKIVRFLFHTNLYGSILFLCCITVNRYIIVCHPVQSMGWINVRRARYISVIVWVVVLSFLAPVLYFSRLKRDICTDTTIPSLFVYFLPYSSVVTVILFLIPLILVIVCNSLMIHKLIQPNSVRSAASHHSRLKSIKIIVIVILVFIICFVPYHFSRTPYYFSRHLIDCDFLEESRMAYKVTRPLSSLNCCLDPILYFMVGQGFRRSFSMTMKRGKRSVEDKSTSQSDPKTENEYDIDDFA